ncbi:MAG: hypothetical protein Q7R47_05890 [Candidatus Diapherotrites archaeon]|nr:hypothetical protein [Candidatus Diapherotrites archaeon]
MFTVLLAANWDKYYAKLDPAIQKQINKKILHLQVLEKVRHLQHGLPYFVVETGQYRICFKEEGNQRTVHFAGNHKQYEKWYKTIEQQL